MPRYWFWKLLILSTCKNKEWKRHLHFVNGLEAWCRWHLRRFHHFHWYRVPSKSLVLLSYRRSPAVAWWVKTHTQSSLSIKVLNPSLPGWQNRLFHFFPPGIASIHTQQSSDLLMASGSEPDVYVAGKADINMECWLATARQEKIAIFLDQNEIKVPNFDTLFLSLCGI